MRQWLVIVVWLATFAGGIWVNWLAARTAGQPIERFMAVLGPVVLVVAITLPLTLWLAGEHIIIKKK